MTITNEITAEIGNGILKETLTLTSGVCPRCESLDPSSKVWIKFARGIDSQEEALISMPVPVHCVKDILTNNCLAEMGESFASLIVSKIMDDWQTVDFTWDSGSRIYSGFLTTSF